MKILKHIRYIALVFLAFLIVLPVLLSGCSGVTFIPGASYGYYVWEDSGKINIQWSVDRKDTTFSGYIKTDGNINDYELIGWEEPDQLEKEKDTISFKSTLSREDYSDGIVISIDEYEYIEFDLKINDGYDLSRVHLGIFLENPENSPFIVEKGYFESVRSIPWYDRHPFSGFFYKLFANKYFTFPFIFILGIIIIELLRITVYVKRKKQALYIIFSYLILIILEVVIFFLLRFMVL